MTDSETLSDRDERLAAAATPAERAEVLGLDWPRLKAAGLTAFFLLVALIILSVVIVSPIAALFEQGGRAMMASEDAQPSLVQLPLAFAPFAVGFVVTQAVLRLGRRWSTARQQAIAISSQAIVGTLGLALVAIVLRDQPGGVVAVLLAGALQGWLVLSGGISVPMGIWRGSKGLGFVVDQNRTLPAGTTVIDGGVAPIFGWALVTSVIGVLVAALVWLHPAFTPLFAVMLVALNLANSRLRWTGRNALALGIAWAFTGVLGAAVILTF